MIIVILIHITNKNSLTVNILGREREREGDLKKRELVGNGGSSSARGSEHAEETSKEHEGNEGGGTRREGDAF